MPYCIDTSTDFARRLTAEDVKRVNNMLASYSDIDTEIDLLVPHVLAGDWQRLCKNDDAEPCIDLDHLPAAALIAYQQGKINFNSLATLLMSYSGWDTYNRASVEPVTYKAILKFRRVVTEKFMLPRCFYRTIIACKLGIPQSDLEYRQGMTSPYLDTDQTKNFLQAAALLPPEEQVIFLLDKDHAPKHKGSISTIAQAIQDSLINFVIFKDIVVSLSLAQLYLRIKFGVQAVDINPVLGLSTGKDMAKSRGAKRDLALFFPGVYLPRMADGFSAPGWLFTLHDLYHCFAQSAIPLEDRVLFLDLSDIAQTFIVKKQCQRVQTLRNLRIDKVCYLNYPEDTRIDYIAEISSDMEHSLYRLLWSPCHFTPKVPAYYFIRSLQVLMSHVLQELFRNRHRSKILVGLSSFSQSQLLEAFFYHIVHTRPDITDFMDECASVLPELFETETEADVRFFKEIWLAWSGLVRNDREESDSEESDSEESDSEESDSEESDSEESDSEHHVVEQTEFDYARWDKKNGRHPITNAPIFTYRAYRGGEEVGSISFYNHPLFYCSQERDRHNILARYGVFSKCDLAECLSNVKDISSILPPTILKQLADTAPDLLEQPISVDVRQYSNGHASSFFKAAPTVEVTEGLTRSFML